MRSYFFFKYYTDLGINAIFSSSYRQAFVLTIFIYLLNKCKLIYHLTLENCFTIKDKIQELLPQFSFIL
jgi:hypothetical protein